ncbi:MAG: DUF4145 domain-containing protein [Chloroflexota bacterium]
MPLPPEIDKKVRDRFTKLADEASELGKWESEWALNAPEAQKFHTLKTNFVSLLSLLSNKQSPQLLNDVRAISPTDENVSASSLRKLVGIILGLKDDYESGMLDGLVEMIEANVAADYLGQAEQLLKEGQPGKYDHVPASVLTGAILEDALHRLCQRQNPPIPLVNAKGEPKTLNPLIDDLKKANVFNELKAKQLRSWADIRNAAAHGEFVKFNRQDVEQMLLGVQNFLADYL